MKRILVPTDFSKHAEYALKVAAQIAKKNDEFALINQDEIQEKAEQFERQIEEVLKKLTIPENILLQLNEELKASSNQEHAQQMQEIAKKK
jgi:nucleotide-binding universal stress UspA family protein